MSAGDIYTTPALEPPLGESSNLVDPYTLHPFLIVTSAICLTLTALCVTIKVFTKVFIMKSFDSEDYLLIFAEAGFAAFTAVMIEAGHAGQGRHQWNVSIAGVQRISLLANILEILYGPIMFAVKWAILIQIKRIFTVHKRGSIYWSAQILIMTNFLVYLALFFAFIFACWPREKLWNPEKEGHCISTNGSILATSTINVVSDAAIFALPMVAITRLQMAQKKKLAVAAVFATGLFACIVSIIRLVYSVILTHSHDTTWAIAPVGMWALAEFATVIIVGCFPTIPRFLRFLQEQKLDSTTTGISGTTFNLSGLRKRHYSYIIGNNSSKTNQTRHDAESQEEDIDAVLNIGDVGSRVQIEALRKPGKVESRTNKSFPDDYVHVETSYSYQSTARF